MIQRASTQSNQKKQSIMRNMPSPFVFQRKLRTPVKQNSVVLVRRHGLSQGALHQKQRNGSESDHTVPIHTLHPLGFVAESKQLANAARFALIFVPHINKGRPITTPIIEKERETPNSRLSPHKVLVF